LPNSLNPPLQLESPSNGNLKNPAKSKFLTVVVAGRQARENLLVTLGIENFTDEDSRVHESGLNEQGLNALIGVKYDW
jgi:outer membrane receptor protein involved in Fe transport